MFTRLSFDPLSHMPAPAGLLAHLVALLAARLSDDDLVWVSENRDFAERERYESKDDVDDALLSSSVVTSERTRIEAMYTGVDPVVASAQYIQMLRAEIQGLHDLHVQALCAISRMTHSQLSAFWDSVCPLADVDNAHAMYLSSDNWPFSVFHALIDELASFSNGVEGALSVLLTAGIHDVRTAVYRMFGNVYSGMPRGDFIRSVRSRSDWIRPNGVMPLMAYKACTQSPIRMSYHSRDIKTEYEVMAQSVAASLSNDGQKRFESVRDAYQALYAARLAYDIYEYFGFYAFARHLMILKTMSELKTVSLATVLPFHYASSTYQFARSANLLKQAFVIQEKSYGLS